MSLHFGAMIPVVSYRSGSDTELSPFSAQVSAGALVEKRAYGGIGGFDPSFNPADGATMAYTLKDGKVAGWYGEGPDAILLDNLEIIGDVFLLTGAEKKAVEKSRKDAFLQAAEEIGTDAFLEELQAYRYEHSGRLKTYLTDKMLKAQDKTLRELKDKPGTRITDVALIDDEYGLTRFERTV